MTESGYYRYPTIHNDSIVFTCEDDLWTVPVKGGLARRLTTGHGECTMPKFSPDGKHIAFVGRDEGHPEVFVIPATGGTAKRLTYIGGWLCYVSGWSEDSKEIYFTTETKAGFFKHVEAMAVSLQGGSPRPLNLGHVQSISFGKNCCAIGRNNNDPARWKRYRGGTAGEIWVDANGSGKFNKLSTISGNQVLPMWIGKRVYLLSDHDGIGNLYSCKPDGSDIKQHTHHKDYFVRFPSTDGKRIVYSAGADIYVLDTATDKSVRVEVVSPPATAQSSRKFVEAKENLEHFSPHPKGHSVALVARGQPLTMGNWEGAAIQHGAGSKVRYRHMEWLRDGERFVVISDATRQERLEVHRADQTESPQFIDGDFGRVIELKVNPASDIVALSNHRQELILVDLKTKKVRELDRSPADRISDMSWSSDGRYIAYNFAPRPSAQIIRVADTKTGELHDITSELSADFSPCFDPEGRYLYFLGARDYHPVYDSLQFDLGFPISVRPYVVTLRNDVPSPFIQKPRPIVAGQAQAAAAQAPAQTPANAPTGKNAKAKKVVAKTSGRGGAKTGTVAPTAESNANEIKIDFDGIQDRILGFPVEAGRYYQLIAAKGRVLFTQFPVKGIEPGGSWMDDHGTAGSLLAYSFEDARVAPVQRNVIWIKLAMDNQTLIYRNRDNLRVIDALMGLPNEGAEPPGPQGTGRKSGWIDLSRAQTLVQPQQEWQQMYDEAWRLQKDQFWDEDMSAIAWDVVHTRYEALLKRVRTRSELSDIIWEMQGELGTSHAYEMGGDYRRNPAAYYRGFLGADFEWDEKSKGYRVIKVLRGESWSKDSDSPLALPGVDIVEGEVIVAVNGRGVARDLTLDELLINCAGREVSLTVVGKDKERKRRNVIARTLRNESMLRYRCWVRANREYVLDKTDGRVGYVHIPNMGPWGFAEFHRGYLADYHRDALIVDARYNGGGHVSPLLLEKLLRKRVGYNISRWGQPQPYPPESVGGPMVCLTNQFAGSDGDIFSHCFKLYNLGPLVGKRTWGGVIGIWPRHRLVDGTMTTQPEFSFWFKDVGWRVENYGTDPDYDVDIKPQDYAAQRDPQMDKALELIMDELDNNPVFLPDFADRPSLPLPHEKAVKPKAKPSLKSSVKVGVKQIVRPTVTTKSKQPIKANAKQSASPVKVNVKTAAKRVAKPLPKPRKRK